ncbi:MAG: hypothetical protein WBQ19_09020 [Terriglobales bacterium]
MWLRLLALLCLVLLSSRSLAQQTPIAIPFEDTSVAGSPIEVTGKISVREMIAGNQVTSRWEENVNARNISNKPILLLIGELVEIGPHSSNGGMLISIDRFFYQNVIQPEASIRLASGVKDTTNAASTLWKKPETRRPTSACYLCNFLMAQLLAIQPQPKMCWRAERPLFTVCRSWPEPTWSMVSLSFKPNWNRLRAGAGKFTGYAGRKSKKG